jgi:hypothetical protein
MTPQAPYTKASPWDTRVDTELRRANAQAPSNRHVAGSPQGQDDALIGTSARFAA